MPKAQPEPEPETTGTDPLPPVHQAVIEEDEDGLTTQVFEVGEDGTTTAVFESAE